jgi:hypothetical protein
VVDRTLDEADVPGDRDDLVGLDELLLGMSVKSVPGCLVTIAPMRIGSPVAFCPLPKPHFAAVVAVSVVDAGVVLAELVLPLSLLSLPQAASATDRAIASTPSTASDKALRHPRLILTAPPPQWKTSWTAARGSAT